jgi:ADP-ribosylglycohydrolase
MRSAIIGAYFAGSPESINDFVAASTLLTHTDPRALTGALAVAHLAGWIAANTQNGDLPGRDILSLLSDLGRPTDSEWRQILERMEMAYGNHYSVREFAAVMGLSKGVSGYIYHSVPIAIYSWLIHYGDFRATLESALNCGGDTDTVGAIAGALAGSVAEAGIPVDWIDGILDWPVTTRSLRRLAANLVEHQAGKAPIKKIDHLWLAAVPRNILLLILVLAHGIRRLAPPY